MRLTKQDQELLAEAYSTVQEGFLDRVKAAGSGVVGSVVQGVGQKLAGKAQQVAGSAISQAGRAIGSSTLSNIGSEAKQSGQSKSDAGAKAGRIAKIESYKKSATKNIDSLMAEITNDLNKLGIAVEQQDLIAAKELLASTLNDALDKLKGS